MKVKRERRTPGIARLTGTGLSGLPCALHKSGSLPQLHLPCGMRQTAVDGRIDSSNCSLS